jgi:replication factor A1
MQETANRDLDN